MTNPNIAPDELKIVKLLLKRASGLDYTISVNDGEDWVVNQSTIASDIIAALASTDADTLRFHTSAGARIGDVWLVWGNGEDLISDNTDNALTNALVDYRSLIA